MPEAPDPDYDPNSATIPLSGPRPTLSGGNVDLPLPEELAKLLPAGAYEITGFLGAGGMGAVYKGMQIRLKRPVAIKIMRRDMGKDHDFEARFEREAQAMAKLNHPNIISVIDFGEAGPDYLFIVMELVDGTDLMDVIRSKQMTQEMALSLLPQICDALQFAHDHGIVHRDIKPSNIMLTRDGRVKMADFGLAKHFDHAESGFRTQTGTGMGTPDYAAPEQFDPTTPVDHRADIYALGVMIYQMITGALPRGVWRPPSQRAPVSTQWDAVVSRAMQNDPSERYQKASEVKTDVSSISLVGADSRLSRQTEAAPPQSRALASAPTKSRAPLLIGLITGSVVIAVGAFFVLRDTGDGRAAGPPAAASGPVPTSDQKAPATPNAALAGASALTKAAPALPESGWKPLVADAVWRAASPDREFADGLLHIKRNTTGSGIIMPQSTADAAIRARIRIRNGTSGPMIQLRQVTDKGRYMVGLYRPTDGGYHVSLLRRIEGGKQEALGTYPLPQPPREGDTLALELRAQEDRLTVLVDGIVRIEANDKAIREAGKWGIQANEAWFESVEVQPLPAAVAGIKLWETPEKLPKQQGVSWENGAVRLDKTVIATDSPAVRDLVFRASMKFGTDNGGGAHLLVRHQEKKHSYALALNGKVIELRLTQGGNVRVLKSWPVPEKYQPEDWLRLEVKAIGPQLTVSVADQVLGTVEDSTLMATGGVSVGVVRTGYFKDIEYVPLDAAAVSPSPNLPVSSSSVATATKDAPFINTLGMKFVPVPGTKALFGIWPTRVQDYAEFAKAQEAAGKKVDSSWKTQQRDGVPAGREPAHPVVGVSWKDAHAFCQWLTEKEIATGTLPQNAKYRLPTDAEWSTAVGLPLEVGASPEEKMNNGTKGVHFPWGKEWPLTSPAGNYADESFHEAFPNPGSKESKMTNDWIKGYADGYVSTSPVGIFPANVYGLCDMGGNVWQWCEDWSSTAQMRRVLRGGSWTSAARDMILSSYRMHVPPEQRSYFWGFRCVLEPAPSSAVSPSPSPPNSKSPDPKFPPGQWVKVFTKPEDLPEDLRKPGSVVKWEDGWIRFDRNASGRPRIDLPSGVPGVTNYAIRVRGIRSKDEISQTAIVLRKHETKFQQYQLSPKGVFLTINRRDGEEYPEIMRFSKPIVQSGAEYVMEFGIVGSQLVARYNDDFMRVQDTTFKQGSAYLSGKDDLSNIEVINLDGLPEAEALRLLGVDEQGNDLRGKGGAAEAWIDALRDPSIVTLTKGAEITPEGIRLPSGSGAYVARSKSLSGDVAMRVRTTFGGPSLQLRVRSEGGRGFYALTMIDDKNVSIQRYDLAADKGIPLRTFTLTTPLKPGEDYEMEFRCVGPALTASLNGEVLGTVTDGTHTEGGCVLSAWEASQTTALAKAFSVLDLSKASASAASSPSSIHSFNGHRYQLISTPSTWAEAKARAEAMGGHLATFTAEAEERWARETLLQPLSAQESAATKAPDTFYWIGGHADAQSKDFRWLSGEPLGKLAWRYGNPGWRERTDMPETKAVGTLFAAGLVVMRPPPSGEWIAVQPQSLKRAGFIVEWDDAGAAAGTAAAPPATAK